MAAGPRMEVLRVTDAFLEMENKSFQCIAANALALILFIVGSLDARSAHADDVEAWAAGVATAELGPEAERWLGYLEVQPRFGDYGIQLIVRPALGFKVFDWATAWLGYAWIPTFANGDTPDRYEHRIWQQWTAAWNPDVVELQSRSRLEQRIITGESDVGLRFRQLFRANWRFVADAVVYMPTTAEFMFDLLETEWSGDSGFEQYRLFGGLGLRLSSEVRIEAGYALVHHIRDPGADDLSHVATISMFVHHQY